MNINCKYLIVILCINLALVSKYAFGADIYLNIAAGNKERIYYSVGAGLGQLIQKNNQHYISSAMSTNDPVENIFLLDSDQAKLAIVPSNIVKKAVNGEGVFTKRAHKNLRSLVPLWVNIVHIVAKKDLKNLNELKGKNVVIGALNKDEEAVACAVLNMAGLSCENKDESKNNIAHVNLNNTELIEAMLNKQADAAIVQAFSPDAGINKLMGTGDFAIMQMPDVYRRALSEEYPYFTHDIVKAGTYYNQSENIKIVGCAVILVVKEEMPEQIAYNITKTIFENLTEFNAINQVTSRLNLENSIKGLNLLLHEGAERYLRENNVLR